MKNFVITEENVKEYSHRIGMWIKENMEQANRKGIVLGLSGGVDCCVVARLCQLSNIIPHLIIMPYDDKMVKDGSFDDCAEFIRKFKFPYHIKNIKPEVDSILQVEDDDSPTTKLIIGNVCSRVRMIHLYQYAQINGFFVIGTSNLSERFTGYCTKWGDMVCDINPLGKVTKREVYILAKYLDIPESIIHKAPSAGFWDGQTDEGEMGFTYDQLNDFLLNGSSGDNLVDDLIMMRNKISQHKLKPIPMFEKPRILEYN